MDRFRLLLAASAVAALGTAFVIACEPAPATTTPINARPDDDKKKKKNTDDDDVLADDDDSHPIKPPADDPLPDGGKPPGRVYAHSAYALYLWDPLVQKLTKVGDFNLKDHGPDIDGNPLEGMIDIALDRDSVMYGTTYFGFVKIDPTTAKVTYIKESDTIFQFPNSLSFVPIGTVDPTKEALVGYVKKDTAATTTYVRVDLATGVLVPQGELNPPGATKTWKSSGDIIAMIRNGNKAYLTVREVDLADGGGDLVASESDSLAEIDPKTGQIISIKGSIGQSNFYGLGQWAGTAYGFNGSGNIVSINLDTGAGTTITTLKFDDGGIVPWYGAGVTTDSPTAP